MDKLLTVANWKKEGAPLRTTGEILKKKNTGVSEALKAFEKADKELMEDVLSIAPLRNAEGALKVLVKALDATVASNPKLQKLVKSMIDATGDYVKNYNSTIRQLDRDSLDGVPGGLKAWKEFTKSQGDVENEEFYQASLSSPKGEKLIGLYDKYLAGGDLNINNQATWNKLVVLWRKNDANPVLRKKIEDELQKELKSTRSQVITNMGDILMNLKARQYFKK